MSSTDTPVIPQYNQDPDADLDYSISWATWLAAEPGDSILESTWTTPTGLTSHDTSVQSGVAVIWLKGGELGVNYEITNHITTVQGRKNDQTIRLFIQAH
jgi:hypothetical protein